MKKENFKYIVILLMLIAHSQFLLPEGSFIRMGLMFFDIACSFVPISMIYFVIGGYYKTRSLVKYMMRLLISGLIAVPFQGYLFGKYQLTYLVSLSLCLLICFIFDKCQYKILRIVLYLCVFIFGHFFCEGKAIIPAIALIMLICKEKNVLLKKRFTIIAMIYFVYLLTTACISGYVPLVIILMIFIQSVSSFCTYFIIKNMSNDIDIKLQVKKRYNKYIPYILYPLHFAILCVVKIILVR